MVATTCPDSAVFPSSARTSLIRPAYLVAMSTCLASSRPLLAANPAGRPGLNSISHATVPPPINKTANATKTNFFDNMIYPNHGDGEHEPIGSDASYGTSTLETRRAICEFLRVHSVQQ